MADKKDSSGGKPNNTPSPGSSAGKKPKPLLDLKATEVRSETAGGPDKSNKPAASTTSHLKGAPDSKTEPSSTAAKMAPATPPPASANSGAAKVSAGADKRPVTTGVATDKATVSDKSKIGDQSKPNDKSAAAKSSRGPSDPKSSPKPAPRRSGGGFFSTLSHLAAGVVGGGLALFAAEPLDQQFGLGLTKAPQMPAALEKRLAALEAKPASSVNDKGLRADVDQLTGKVEAAEKRLAELDKLGQEVANLTRDVAAAGSSSRPAANSSNASNAASSAAAPSALRARLAKLESALATLSSATGPSGKPAGIAPLAQFSAKFADLESSLNAQLSALRKGLLSEMETRIASTANASSKAVASTERLNRDVSEIKTDTARLEQRAVVLKTASDKLAATTRAVSEQAAELKVELDGLKGSLQQELTKVVRPADLKSAIAPVASKIAAIEKNLGSVIASETARKQNAERIVLSLELSNLKRVLDRGAPYASELADVKKVAGDAIDFAALETHKSDGVPSSQALTRQFSKVAFEIINAQNAPKDPSRINRLLAAAKSIVQVRRTDVPAKANTAEAAVARIEKRLKDGDLSGALSLAEKLPDEAKAPAKDWMSKLAARAGVDRAIAKIETQLKASLGGGASSDKS